MRAVAGAVAVLASVLVASGCASSRAVNAGPEVVQLKTSRSGIADNVRVVGGSRRTIGGVNLRHSARFLSPTRLAILTWGSFTCPAVPNRLAVDTPDRIRIHLTTGSWHGKRPVAHLPPGGACTADHSSAVIVIAIDPKLINVHHRLTIRLYYYSIKKPQISTALPL
jgi:hypothetical protein